MTDTQTPEFPGSVDAGIAAGAPSLSWTGSASNSTPGPAVQSGFDFARHEKVNGYRADGIWTLLGERFGDLEFRIRPFTEAAVVVAKEAAEQALRAQLGIGEDEPLPGDKALLVNRAAVTAAVTGVRGRLRGTPELLALARRNGWKIEGEDWLVLGGHESGSGIGDLVGVLLASGTSLLMTLVRLSRALQTVRDQELDEVGKDFVYGRHVRRGWEA